MWSKLNIFAYVLPLHPRMWLMTEYDKKKHCASLPDDGHAFPTVMPRALMAGSARWMQGRTRWMPMPGRTR